MSLSSDFVPSRIKSSDPLHEPRLLTADQREVFRVRAREARLAKDAAAAGTGGEPFHLVNTPAFDPNELMPQLDLKELTTLSMFSGGGGLDLGFDRAGFSHAGSWEILPDAAQTLRAARPNWDVYGGSEGDVRGVDWRAYRGNIAVLHGGPPCQPFSNAGKQRGASDPRDMWPEFVRAVLAVRPDVFVAENVAALASSTFSEYVKENILRPLGKSYEIHKVLLQAYEYGVPQIRKRVVFVGFRNKTLARKWVAPKPQYRRLDDPTGHLPPAIGARAALGLEDIGFDGPSPTIRSGLSGPRHTTSILSSVSAQRKFEALGIWPNGVAANREAASAYIAKNGHFRLAVADVALLQGFPEEWKFYGATYMQLGQIGNSVVPPVAYAVATSVRAVFK
ncbi:MULTISPECIES: DNA (cytosine-5-)-methyltransferase [unclassified Frigoribacterium]|uniref:DNA cytosine methyltransferase n=1 Tax=unclassified Frigoribacterium TaxID=2627005 RepID=UPI001C208C40